MDEPTTVVPFPINKQLEVLSGQFNASPPLFLKIQFVINLPPPIAEPYLPGMKIIL